MVDGERLAAAAGPVQSLHQPQVEGFVQMVGGHQGAELTDEFPVAVVRQIRLDPQQDGLQALLLQIDREPPEKGTRHDVRRHRPAPQVDRLPQQVGRGGGPALGQGVLPAAHQVLELEDIQVVPRHLEEITTRPGHHDLRAPRPLEAALEQLPQLVHVGLHDRLDGAGRPVRPELVDELLDGHQRVRVDGEHRQHLPNLGRCDSEGGRAGRRRHDMTDFEWTQDLYLQTGCDHHSLPWIPGVAPGLSGHRYTTLDTELVHAPARPLDPSTHPSTIMAQFNMQIIRIRQSPALR
ncbi:hypothetical protein FRACA_2520009 [Frankia canadensis]|uniref:Uncharacterized protein n=1 Tax=Frankia canadensis TaxID=1836972 RepID=A0A2I2KS69_9ACTN|nr:hypothetical protein FRACA_2520009 [Frankia canadensis]SOU55789.1 hypothetical protein FRACA_2520009 [Frankia canadensis]